MGSRITVVMREISDVAMVERRNSPHFIRPVGSTEIWKARVREIADAYYRSYQSSIVSRASFLGMKDGSMQGRQCIYECASCLRRLCPMMLELTS